MRRRITQGRTWFIVISTLLTGTLCFGQISPSQISKSQIYTTKYFDYDALGVNPANLAAYWRPDKKVSFGLLSTNFTLYSRGIKNDLLHGGDLSNLADVSHWINDIFAERNAVNLESTVLGLNFHTKKAGSFAFSAKVNLYGEAELNGVLENLNLGGADLEELPDILMSALQNNNGASSNEEPSYINLSAIAEANVVYRKRILNNK